MVGAAKIGAGLDTVGAGEARVRLSIQIQGPVRDIPQPEAAQQDATFDLNQEVCCIPCAIRFVIDFQLAGAPVNKTAPNPFAAGLIERVTAGGQRSDFQPEAEIRPEQV